MDSNSEAPTPKKPRLEGTKLFAMADDEGGTETNLENLTKEEILHMFKTANARAEAEKSRAEAEKSRADTADARAEAEKSRADSLDYDFSVMRQLKHTPIMKVNEACMPSIISNEAARSKANEHRNLLAAYHKKLHRLRSTRKRGAQPERPRRNFHFPAKIEIMPLDSGMVAGFDIHMRNSSGSLIKSPLLIKLGASSTDKQELPHVNESSPQDYIAMGIDTGILCCGLAGQFQVAKEATLFALRPDLVVVLLHGRILFAVEVKNPSKANRESVFNSESAAGQTLDYLLALKQQGIDWPFVLLSTYNQSVIARLPGDDEKYQAILKKGALNAKLRPPERHREASSPLHSKKEKTSPAKPTSYERLLCISTQGNRRPGSKSQHLEEEDSEKEIIVGADEDHGRLESFDGEYDYQGRGVVYSEVFDVQQLLRYVVLLLESSLVSFEESKETLDPLLPKEGATLSKKGILTLYKSGYAFEHVDNIEVTYNRPPMISKMIKYHVLCQIGQGGTGKTILCSSSSGTIFAVKLFLVNASTHFCPEEREKEQQKWISEKLQEAKNECSQWHELQQQYKNYCHLITLNGLPAITMPFFPAVPKDERNNALPFIRESLQHVAQKGYYYHGNDLRWRHFGCRWKPNGGEMEITLLDLGSLRKEEKDIDEQIEELRKRMGTEEDGEIKPVLPPK